MEIDENKKDNKGLIVASACVIIGVVGLWSITLFTLVGKSQAERGTFGDMFGGVNALFSGLAFGGIIITILLQRKELSLQRKEIRNSTEEMRQSNIHFLSQNEAIINQQYQTTFFHLLNTHADRVSNMKFKDGYGHEGLINCFVESLGHVETWNKNIALGIFPSTQTVNNPRYIFDAYQDSWIAYFENLKTLVEYVKLKLKDELYYQLIYNVLTTEEKYFIGLYCDCCDSELTDVIKKCDFPFRKYYSTHKHRYHLWVDTYCPIIKIRNVSRNQFYQVNNILNETESYQISYEIGFDHFNQETKLLNIDLQISYIEPVNAKCMLLRRQFSPAEVPQTQTVGNEILFNLSEYVNNTLKDYRKGNSITVYVGFEIGYAEKKYTIVSTSNIRCETARGSFFQFY